MRAIVKFYRVNSALLWRAGRGLYGHASITSGADVVMLVGVSQALTAQQMGLA